MTPAHSLGATTGSALSEPDLLAALARHVGGTDDARAERVDTIALTGGHSTKPIDRLDLSVATATGFIRAAVVRKRCLAAEVRALEQCVAVPGATAAPELIIAWWSTEQPYALEANGFVCPFYPGGPLTADDEIPDTVLTTLANVHAHTGRAAPPDWTWTFDTAHFELRHAYALAALAASGRFKAITPDHVDWLRRLERIGREPLLRRMSDVLPRSLVHGDLHPRNIVLRADGSPVIIDWGNACIAPPMLDLANIVAPGSSAWQRYLVAYREAGGPIDAETCERAYWWGHAAASLLELPWAAAHRFDAPRLITRIEAAHDQLARRC